MGESDRYTDYSRRKISFGDNGNALIMVICINAVIFVSLWMIEVIGLLMDQPRGYFEEKILPWFIYPAKLSLLAERPWTLLTQMFTHSGLLHTITNMLWLWVFGYILQSITGNRKLIPIYIYGGLAGAIAFTLAVNLIPVFRANLNFANTFGANAATMAVALATTALAPDYRFFKMLNGGIPLWILTLLYVAIDFAGVSQGSGAYHISHLAGGLIGFLFVFSLRKGSDWSAWMNRLYDFVINLFNPNKPRLTKSRIKEKVFYKTGNQKPFVKTTNITQQRIDEILDKINVQGYHLLTDEEKNILKRAGEDL